MKVQEAISKAVQFAHETLSETSQLTVEEVEYKQDGPDADSWYITLGFKRRLPEKSKGHVVDSILQRYQPTYSSNSDYEDVYKLIIIKDDNSIPIMKIRKV